LSLLARRIADKRLLALIEQLTTNGVRQGDVSSPVFCGIYLAHVVDRWAREMFQQCRGATTIARYVDDLVAGFERREEAQRFARELNARLQAWGLSTRAEKTRLFRKGEPFD